MVLSSNEASLQNFSLAEYHLFLRFHERNLIFLRNASSVNFLCSHAFFVSSCNACPHIKQVLRPVHSLHSIPHIWLIWLLLLFSGSDAHQLHDTVTPVSNLLLQSCCKWYYTWDWQSNFKMFGLARKNSIQCHLHNLIPNFSDKMIIRSLQIVAAVLIVNVRWGSGESMTKFARFLVFNVPIPLRICIIHSSIKSTFIMGNSSYTLQN